MFWKILRPHYWMLDRKVRSTNRLVIIGLILVVLYGVDWIYRNWILDLLSAMNPEQMAATTAMFLPLGIFLLLLFGMLGLGDVVKQLYFTPDLELLMVSPVPPRTIFLFKLLQSSRALQVPAFVFTIYLISLGIVQAAHLGYYLLSVTLIVTIVFSITSLLFTLVLFLGRYIPAQRVRTWMPVAIILATLGLLLGQQAATNWFLNRVASISFLTDAFLATRNQGILAAGFSGLAIATSLFAYLVFIKSFHEGWNRLREVPSQKHLASRNRTRRGLIDRLARAFPGSLGPFVVKEWQEFRRNPRALIILGQPLVMVIVSLLPMLSAGAAGEMLRPLVFWFMLGYLVLFLSTLPLSTAVNTLAQEGLNLALLRSLPVVMLDLLKGKFWAGWLPVSTSWVVVLLAVGLWTKFSALQIAFLIFAALWISAVTSAADLAIGGLLIDFNGENLRQRVPPSATLIFYGFNFVFSLLSTTTLLALTARVFPGSKIWQTALSLTGNQIAGWQVPGRWLPIILLVAGQIVSIGATFALWREAIKRLENWQ